MLSFAPVEHAYIYSIYFGQGSPSELIAAETETSCNPGVLEPNTTYRWRVDVLADDGETVVIGDVWSFTTRPATPPLPAKPTNPNPPDGATNQPVNVVLSWADGGRATGFRIYFGTNPTLGESAFRGSQSAASFNPGTLAYNADYYWRVDATSPGGTTQGDVWRFSTGSAPLRLPSQATRPSPSHNAMNQLINLVLSWINGEGATSCDVYFGTTPTPGPSEFRANQSAVSFDPGTLAFNANYYWRIDTRNAAGRTVGDVWSFRTEREPVGPYIGFRRLDKAAGLSEGGPSYHYEVYVSNTEGVCDDVDIEVEELTSPAQLQRISVRPRGNAEWTVTVVANDDTIKEGDHEAILKHSLVSNNPFCNGRNANYEVSIIDNDTRGIGYAYVSEPPQPKSLCPEWNVGKAMHISIARGTLFTDVPVCRVESAVGQTIDFQLH